MSFGDHGGCGRTPIPFSLIDMPDLESELRMCPCPADEEPGAPHQFLVVSANSVPGNTVLVTSLVAALQPNSRAGRRRHPA
jgi:hypothetical protein